MKSIKIIDQDTNDSFELFDVSNDSLLRRFDGFEYAEVKLAVDDVFGVPGSTYVTSSHGRRRMSFQGDLVGANIFANRRNLLKAMRQTGKMKLFEVKTYDDLELQFEAEIARFTNPYTHMIHTFLFEIVAPDFRFYSQTESTETYTANQTKNTNNGGTEQTTPVFTITGPGNNIEVQNNDSGLSFNIGNLTAGQEVVVDGNTRTVTLNTNPAFSIFSGDMFNLAPGNTGITFSVPTGSDGNTELEITYRDAYNGI